MDISPPPSPSARSPSGAIHARTGSMHSTESNPLGSESPNVTDSEPDEPVAEDRSDYRTRPRAVLSPAVWSPEQVLSHEQGHEPFTPRRCRRGFRQDLDNYHAHSHSRNRLKRDHFEDKDPATSSLPDATSNAKNSTCLPIHFRRQLVSSLSLVVDHQPFDPVNPASFNPPIGFQSGWTNQLPGRDDNLKQEVKPYHSRPLPPIPVVNPLPQPQREHAVVTSCIRVDRAFDLVRRASEQSLRDSYHQCAQEVKRLIDRPSSAPPVRLDPRQCTAKFAETTSHGCENLITVLRPPELCRLPLDNLDRARSQFAPNPNDSPPADHGAYNSHLFGLEASRSTDTLQQSVQGSGIQAGTEAEFPCLFSHPNDPSAGDPKVCTTRCRYVSGHVRHMGNKHDFFCCTKCCDKFTTPEQRERHEQSCKWKCVTVGCHNYGSIPAVKCNHTGIGGKNTQQSIWNYLFRLARPRDPIPDLGPRTVGPLSPLSLAGAPAPMTPTNWSSTQDQADVRSPLHVAADQRHLTQITAGSSTTFDLPDRMIDKLKLLVDGMLHRVQSGLQGMNDFLAGIYDLYVLRPQSSSSTDRKNSPRIIICELQQVSQALHDLLVNPESENTEDSRRICSLARMLLGRPNDDFNPASHSTPPVYFPCEFSTGNHSSNAMYNAHTHGPPDVTSSAEDEGREWNSQSHLQTTGDFDGNQGGWSEAADTSFSGPNHHEYSNAPDGSFWGSQDSVQQAGIPPQYFPYTHSDSFVAMPNQPKEGRYGDSTYGTQSVD